MVAGQQKQPTGKSRAVSKDEYYRQRITVKKVDEDGKGLPGIQFTLDAKNIDELYSFEVTDRDGTDLGTADTNNDTEFSITGYTRNSGRIAWRMTYYIYTEEYAYYPDDELKKMSAEEKTASMKVLTDEADER